MKKDEPLIISFDEIDEIDFLLISSGQGLLETMKYSNGVLWFKQFHFDRLQKSAKLLNNEICINSLNEYLVKKIDKLVKNSSCTIRVIVPFSFTKKSSSVKIIVQFLEMKEVGNINNSISLKLFPIKSGSLNQHKTINFGCNFYNKGLAISQGYEDVIFFDNNNELMESSTSNIFGVKGKEVVTPPLNGKILPGTIRRVICENLSVIEKAIAVSNIKDYDYFFLTNSIEELTLVSRIDNMKFEMKRSSWKNYLDKWQKIKKQYIQGNK